MKRGILICPFLFHLRADREYAREVGPSLERGEARIVGGKRGVGLWGFKEQGDLRVCCLLLR